MSEPAYTQEKVLTRFEILLSGMDFKHELTLLEISSIRFFLRKKIKKELESAVIALWRLNLEKSFPRDWNCILENFIAEKKASGGSDGIEFEQRVRNYLLLFEKRRDADFTGPASHIAAVARIHQNKTPAITLKLAIRFRRLNKIIFDNLI